MFEYSVEILHLLEHVKYGVKGGQFPAASLILNSLNTHLSFNCNPYRIGRWSGKLLAILTRLPLSKLLKNGIHSLSCFNFVRLIINAMCRWLTATCWPWILAWAPIEIRIWKLSLFHHLQQAEVSTATIAVARAPCTSMLHPPPRRTARARFITRLIVPKCGMLIMWLEFIGRRLCLAKSLSPGK